MKKNIWTLLVVAVLGTMPWLAADAALRWSADDYDLYPGDFDGDGKSDLLYVAKSPAGVSGIARSDASGGPNTSWQTWLGNHLGIPWHSNLYAVLVGDFNDDGRSDLFLQRSSPGDHYLLLANQNGKFTAISQTIPNSYQTQVWSRDQHRIHVGNFDGLAGDDLFLQGATPSIEHAVYLSNVSGQFTSAPTQRWFDAGWTAFSWSVRNSNIFVGDFDGNGSSDLLVQGKPTIVLVDFDVSIPIPTYAPNIFGVALSQGGASPFVQSGIRQWSRTAFGADWSPARHDIVVGDFSGDGVTDVLLQARSSGGTSRLLVANASSTGNKFANATDVVTNVSWSANGYRLIAGNFDGTGATGVYAQARDAGGTNYYTNVVGSTVSATAHSPVQPGGIVPATVVGRTPGSFAVSSIGAATYTVPLWTPPGPRGVQPNLALTYDSNAGNGVLGVGWSLSGLSSIERCNRTIAQDGATGGVTLGSNDRFCLNGKRLQLSSGTNAADGSKYRLELDEFAVVTAVGAVGGGPNYFVMRDRNGLYHEFGATADSQVAATGSSTPFRWKLNKVVDTAGNSYVVSYSNISGHAVPTAISWSPTGPGGSTYQYTAVFAYIDTRTAQDTTQGYVAGMYVSNNRRLESIQVRHSTNGIAQTVRKYTLGYDIAPQTKRSRLISIQECADDSSNACLSPTVVAYQDGGSVGTGAIPGGNAASAMLSAPRDFDGDGRDDLVYVIGSTWHVAFATDGGFSTPRNTGIASSTTPLSDRFLRSNQDGLLARSGSVWRYYSWSESSQAFQATDTNAAAGSPVAAALADTNGDGLADLVWAVSGNQIYIRRNTSALGATVPSFESTANLAATLPTSGNGNISSFRDGEWQGMRRHDFDGDGKQDLMVVSIMNAGGGGPISYWYRSTPLLARDATFDIGSAPLASLSAIPSSSGGVNFNDDICTDRVFINSVYIEKCGSNPAAFVSLPATPLLVMDWDGDGRSDFLAASGSSLVVYRSLGNAIGAAEATGVPYSAGNYFEIDQDGDGQDDIVHVANGAPNTVTFYKRTSSGSTLPFDVATPDLAVSFTDGFGVNYSPGYVSTARSSYTEAPTDDPKMRTMTGSRKVVGQVTSSNGSGGTYNRTYEYFAGRTNLDRDDFAGFEIVKEVDKRTDLVRRTTYEQLFPYTGLVKKAELLQSNGTTPIQVTTNTPGHFSYLFNSAHPRYFPYVATSEAKQHEFLGTLNGQLLYTATTTNTFDSNNGALTDAVTHVVESSTANGLQSGATHTSEMHITPFNDTASNCLGKPATIREKRLSTLPGSSGAAITRSTDVIWNGTHCRPDYVIVEPGDTRWQVTTGFGYDGFGNVDSLTETPVAVAAHSPQQVARTTTVNWGSTGQFPSVVTNPLSQQTRYGWNRALGVMTSSTDPNNIATYWYADLFGRMIQESRPDGTRSELHLTACNAGNGYCSGASDLRLKVQGNVYDNVGALVRSDSQYLDRFEKLRYDERLLLSGAVSRAITTYDSMGRRLTQSVPHIGAGPQGITTYAYDHLGRVTSVTRPVSETNLAHPPVSISYLGLRREVSDTRVTPTRVTAEVVDPLGRAIRSIDAANNDVDYAYDAFNNLLTTTDANNNQITLTYNQRGWTLSSSDPDLGYWQYDYYPLGELRWQKDANLREVKLVYDSLSRVTSRQELEGTTYFTFDTAPHGVGQLHTTTTPGGHSETLSYDIAGRMTQRSIQADSVAYDYIYGYNSAGLLDTLAYPQSTADAPFKVQYGYQYGVNNSVRSYVGNSPGTVYWQATSNTVNANGQYIDEQYGNGLRTRSTYDLVSGLIKDRKTGPGVSHGVQHLGFTWYANGQLETRSDNNQSLTEAFYYDSLGRLDWSSLNGSLNLNVDYDALGNIARKSGVGDYVYGHATKKHAVTSTTGVPAHSYTYDNNGNMLTRDGATTDWFSFNLPQTIRSATATSTFSYDHARQRWKQQSSIGGASETITYVGDLFEKRVVGPDVEYRHLIIAGNGPVGYVERRTGTAAGTSTYYVATDHLAGTSVITDDTGAVLVKASFDAFGQRRGSNWAGAPTMPEMAQIATTTRRGFTFHEHLDNLNLIHMNGRVYDPMLGRFASADPFVQAPFNTQSFNRYSYTFNDPLSNVDPSGFSCWHSERTIQGENSVTVEADRFDTCSPPAWWYTGTGGTGGGGGFGRGDSTSGSDGTVSTTGGTVLAGAALPAGRAAARNPYMLGGAVVIGGSLYVVLKYSQTAGALRRPDYMSGPEYVPPSGPLDIGGATSPGDPNQFDPNGKRGETVVVLGTRDGGTARLANEVGGRHFLDSPTWRNDVLSAIREPNTRFVINLNGLSGDSTYAQVMRAAQTPGSSATNWEISQLHQAGRLPNVTFMRNGSVVPNPFAP